MIVLLNMDRFIGASFSRVWLSLRIEYLCYRRQLVSLSCEIYAYSSFISKTLFVIIPFLQIFTIIHYQFIRLNIMIYNLATFPSTRLHSLYLSFDLIIAWDTHMHNHIGISLQLKIQHISISLNLRWDLVMMIWH